MAAIGLLARVCGENFAALRTEISGIRNDIAALKTTTEQTNTNLTVLDARVKALEETSDGWGGRMRSFEDTAGHLADQVLALTQAVNALRRDLAMHASQPDHTPIAELARTVR